MSTYKPYKDRKKALEDAIKDLSPGIRELAKDTIRGYVGRERPKPRVLTRRQQDT